MIELDIIDAKAARGASEQEASDQEAAPKERYWRGWGDLTGQPAHQDIVRNEFMDGASKPPSGASRREFFKVMGASMALAGLTACRRPVEKIVPYVRKPEEVTEGVPLFYATAMPFRGVLRPLLVESHEGRPTKVEGNPEHPDSQGATSGFEQASVLNLYDPWRSTEVRAEGGEASWDAFMALARRLTGRAGQARLVVLHEPTSSPTVAAVRQKLEAAYGEVQWIEYGGGGVDAQRLGMQEAFGQPYRPRYRFDRADVVVSIDADFLSPVDLDFVSNTRRFAQSRRLEGRPGGMSRLYCVESSFSLTGGQADNRLPLAPSEIEQVARALAAELGAGGRAPSGLSEEAQTFVGEMAADLQGAGSRGVVVPGDTASPAVHALCMAINSTLGAVGTTVELFDTGAEPAPDAEQFAQLVRDMRAGEVDVLLTVGTNPAYDLPAALGFAEAMAEVPETIHVGTHLDETAQLSRWHVPRTHYLEQWGDGRSYEGTLSVIQPLIDPLYPTCHSGIEVVNALATGLDETGYDLVRTTWQGQVPGTFEEGWRRALHEGFLPDTQYATVQASASAPSGGSPAARAAGDLEVVLRLDPKVLAGAYANNAWMQELPDPVTKVTWDNVALMSHATAEALGVGVEYDAGKFYADVVELSTGAAAVQLPVWVQPGYPDGTIGLTLGYGRQLASERAWDGGSWFARLWDAYDGVYDQPEPLANGIGANVSVLQGSDLARVVRGVEVTPAGGTHLVATTQEHWSMEGRPLARRATIEEYEANPSFAPDMTHMISGVEEESYDDYPTLWEEQHPTDQPAYADSDYYENQWGMTIDLNTCTGCNACIVACQSENNVQVVGKDEVARGREMHWLRLDRYYVSPGAGSGHGGEGGSVEDDFRNAQMLVQPVMCQHCENAPCESVCPVAATVHSPDGTNQMIYNRCIGTRYCSNNCPYKVRRFNFYNWSRDLPTTVQMAQNPKVSVRFRGVMEKCSWCVHRIRDAQQKANKEERPMADGDVQTACQQVCPAEAITFGDLNDPESAVVRAKSDSRRYEMLAELNVKPRLSYLGRVTNPNTTLLPAAAYDPSHAASGHGGDGHAGEAPAAPDANH